MSSLGTKTQSAWCKIAKCELPSSSKLFLRSFTGQKVQSPDGKDVEIYAQTSQRPKALYGKGSKHRQRRKVTLRLLKQGKGSLRDIAEITHFDKSTLSRIGKCLRSKDIRAKNTPVIYSAGKKVMTRWFEPLPAESYGAHIFTENNWFPSNGIMKMSEKGLWQAT